MDSNGRFCLFQVIGTYMYDFPDQKSNKVGYDKTEVFRVAAMLPNAASR